MRTREVRTLSKQVKRAQRAGDPHALIEALEPLCALTPDDPQHWKTLGGAYHEIGRPLDAVAALVRAAGLFTEAGAGIQAIAVCKWILEFDPTHTATIDRLARLQKASSGAPNLPEHGRPHPARPAAPVAPIASGGPPIEEIMLRDVSGAASPPDAEGHREIPLEHPHSAGLDDTTRLAARGLVSTPLFGRLGARALRRLIDASRLVRLSEGEVLFRQGDPADALYVVAAGAVVPIAEDGSRHKLSVLEPGDFFGEIALVTDQPRNATIQALVDSELLAIDRAVIARLLDEEPEVLAITLRFLRKRLVARLLATSAVFSEVERAERAELIRAFRLMEIPADGVLVEQDQSSRALFLVLAGELRVVRSNPGGDKEIATLRAGDPCGEMSLLDDVPAMASVRAVRKSWVLVLPRGEFDRVVLRHPQLGKRLERIASQRRFLASEGRRQLRAEPT